MLHSASRRTISIHALREEGDSLVQCRFHCGKKFQSTPSARRATGRACCFQPVSSYFNPRPPRGGRLIPFWCAATRQRFQSTPSARRATEHPPRKQKGDTFQSTPSARRATCVLASGGRCWRNFNPRPPRGGRPYEDTGKIVAVLFQSTPSARRATRHAQACPVGPDDFNPRPPRGGRRQRNHLPASHHPISIHALREEGDRCMTPDRSPHIGFQSTPSARRATHSGRHGTGLQAISIHALREEGDDKYNAKCTQINLFQSTPSARRATAPAPRLRHKVDISIHALREEGDLAGG